MSNPLSFSLFLTMEAAFSPLKPAAATVYSTIYSVFMLFYSQVTGIMSRVLKRVDRLIKVSAHSLKGGPAGLAG
jgi:hypothetical protein